MRTRAIATSLSLLLIGLAPAFAPAEDGATDVAGIPAGQVGTHGPKTNYLDGLELVGHTPIPVDTVDADDNPIVLPIGNNGAPALMGNCAYVGRWHDYTTERGIQIIDISDPATPTRVGQLTEGLPAGSVAREIRTVEDGDFRLLVVLLFSQYIDSGALTPGLNGVNLYTIGSDCTDITFAGNYDMGAFRPHEYFLWADPNPAHDVDGHPRLLVYITAPIAPPNVRVVDISNPAAPALLTAYDAGLPVISPREEAGTGLGTYAHSIWVEPDGRYAHLSYWDGGFFTIDTSAVADASPVPLMRPAGANTIPYLPPVDEFANTHSAVQIPGTNDAVVGSEIYISTDGCPFGWLTVVRAGDATTPPAKIGEFKLEENRSCAPRASVLPTGAPPGPASKNDLGQFIDGTFTMHNQTVTDHFVFASWYGGGVRVIDVSNPATPVEAGFFVPAALEATATNPNTSAPTYGTMTPSNVDDDWWVATWSYPVIRDGLIYVTDVRNGLYILKPAPGASFAAEIAAIDFLEGNSNIGSF